MNHSNSKYLYLNDQYTLEDSLEIAATGDALAKMVLQAQPPFSVRVTGKWGSGKTSVLRRAFFVLGGKPIQQAVPLSDDNIKESEWTRHEEKISDLQKAIRDSDFPDDVAEKSLCVWYSPWLHQSADNPLVPLLLEIRNQFSTWMKMRGKLDVFNQRGGLAALTLIEQVADAAVSLGFQKNMKIVQGTTEKVRKAWKEAAPDLLSLSNGQRFHLLFENAVKHLLMSVAQKKKNDKKNHKPAGSDAVNKQETKDDTSQERLILFIDDLDRCEESVVVNLLECIKLYLGTPQCVFVLGIDDNAVLGAMKRTWDGRNDEDNREYLEKMFQATLAVPVPKPGRIRSLINDQLDAHGFPEAGSEKWPGSPRAVQRLLEPNPRKIKNFCNSLCLSWNLFRGFERKEEEDFAPKFVLFHYLRIFHKPVWNILERQPESLKTLTSLFSKEFPSNESEQQRMLREFFTREFIHVLEDKDVGIDKAQQHFYHRGMNLSAAVELFQARRDSRRSDEYFIELYKKIFDKDDVLEDRFLYLEEINSSNPADDVSPQTMPEGKENQ